MLMGRVNSRPFARACSQLHERIHLSPPPQPQNLTSFGLIPATHCPPNGRFRGAPISQIHASEQISGLARGGVTHVGPPAQPPELPSWLVIVTQRWVVRLATQRLKLVAHVTHSGSWLATQRLKLVGPRDPQWVVSATRRPKRSHQSRDPRLEAGCHETRYRVVHATQRGGGRPQPT